MNDVTVGKLVEFGDSIFDFMYIILSFIYIMYHIIQNSKDDKESTEKHLKELMELADDVKSGNSKKLKKKSKNAKKLLMGVLSPTSDDENNKAKKLLMEALASTSGGVKSKSAQRFLMETLSSTFDENNKITQKLFLETSTSEDENARSDKKLIKEGSRKNQGVKSKSAKRLHMEMLSPKYEDEKFKTSSDFIYEISPIVDKEKSKKKSLLETLSPTTSEAEICEPQKSFMEQIFLSNEVETNKKMRPRETLPSTFEFENGNNSKILLLESSPKKEKLKQFDLEKQKTPKKFTDEAKNDTPTKKVFMETIFPTTEGEKMIIETSPTRGDMSYLI